MRAALAALVFLFAAVLGPCGSRITVLSYNVQNLFDDQVDGTEYRDYLPPRWGPEQAAAKLTAVGRAIRRAAGGAAVLSAGGAPDLIALQEVENLRVLLALRDRHLADLGYRHAVLAPQKGVATQVAVLSRLPVVRTAVHPVGTFAGAPLRHILEVEIEHQGRRLVLLNNHWKSKTGGVAATAEARRRAAAVVRRRVAELLQLDPAADILVVGDLNENLEEHLEAQGRYPTALRPWPAGRSAGTAGQGPADADRSVPPGGGGAAADAQGELLLCPRPEQAGMSEEGLGLYEPWYELPPEQRGSYVYEDRWQTPDHMLLTPGLFDRRGFSYRPGSFRVARQRHLLHPLTGYPMAFRPASGGRGGSGTSDHLPLLLELEAP